MKTTNSGTLLCQEGSEDLEVEGGNLEDVRNNELQEPLGSEIIIRVGVVERS